MTEKELRKLSRSELLELLYAMRSEIDKLQAENNQLELKLQAAGSDHELLQRIYETVCGDAAKSQNDNESKNQDGLEHEE